MPTFVKCTRFHQRVMELETGQNRLRELSPPLFLRALVCLMIGYLITEWVARPMETLSLPEIDWHQGLSDIFLHGVLNPPEGGG
ncbi:MAG: hypothetical protein A2Z14_08940 [Chloroflexi bacterium RBG_16_48_8]|nr:MAG: hypothetical protein A2Z14_08940 [Chloroflexi bacterium RBG_16_48_8]